MNAAAALLILAAWTGDAPSPCDPALDNAVLQAETSAVHPFSIYAPPPDHAHIAKRLNDLDKWADDLGSCLKPLWKKWIATDRRVVANQEKWEREREAAQRRAESLPSPPPIIIEIGP